MSPCDNTFGKTRSRTAVMRQSRVTMLLVGGQSCLFLWCQYSHHGPFPSTNVTWIVEESPVVGARGPGHVGGTATPPSAQDWWVRRGRELGSGGLAGSPDVRVPSSRVARRDLLLVPMEHRRASVSVDVTPVRNHACTLSLSRATSPSTAHPTGMGRTWGFPGVRACQLTALSDVGAAAISCPTKVRGGRAVSS